VLFKSSLLAACLALAASLAPASAQVRSNLLVAVDDVVDPVILPAYEVEYAVQVSNLSATPMTGVTVTADTPEGTYFGEASTNVGALEAPAQGRPGKMVVSAETLAKYLKQHRNTALVAFHNANGSVAAAVYGPLTPAG